MSVDLPAPFDSHQRDPVAAFDDEADAAEDFLGAVALRRVAEFGHHPAAGLGLRKREVDGLLILRRHFDFLHPLQFLDAALRLFGLGGLIAEAVDEGLQLAHAVLLVLVGGFQLRAALGLQLEIARVVPRIDLQLLVPDLDDFRDGDVEEVAVVRNQQERVGIGEEVLLQPVPRLEIQVVGGLVEQQQVGLLEQQLGERDAHLPPARKLLGAAVPVVLGEFEPAQDGAHLGFERISIAGAELMLDAVEAVGDIGVFPAGGIEPRHAPGQGFHLGFHGAQVLEDGEALGEHGAAGKAQAVLRQEAGPDVLHGGDAAVVQALLAGQDFQEGGLAAAVGADEPDAVAGVDLPVRALKQQPLAESFAGGN